MPTPNKSEHYLEDVCVLLSHYVPIPEIRMTDQRGGRMDRGSPEISMKMTGRKMMAQEAKRKVKKTNSAKGAGDFIEWVAVIFRSEA